MSTNMDSLDQYRLSITQTVCSVCCKPDENGVCSIGDRESCTIDRHLPRIIEVISSIRSSRYEDYIPALRETICGQCAFGNDENCDYRGTDVCMLDRYLPLIIEAVERVNLDRKL